MIISRINGFTYVQTKYDYLSADVKEDHALTVVKEVAYSNGERSKVKCYGADDVREGVDDAGNAVGDAVDDVGNAIRDGADAVTGDNNNAAKQPNTANGTNAPAENP